MRVAITGGIVSGGQSLRQVRDQGKSTLIRRAAMAAFPSHPVPQSLGPPCVARPFAPERVTTSPPHWWQIRKADALAVSDAQQHDRADGGSINVDATPAGSPRRGIAVSVRVEGAVVVHGHADGGQSRSIR